MIKPFILTLFLSGCATLEFETAGSTPTVTHEYRTSHLFWGAIATTNGEVPVPACPRGTFRNATLRMSTGDVLLTGLTLGIYVPHRATVRCAQP